MTTRRLSRASRVTIREGEKDISFQPSSGTRDRRILLTSCDFSVSDGVADNEFGQRVQHFRLNSSSKRSSSISRMVTHGTQKVHSVRIHLELDILPIGLQAFLITMKKSLVSDFAILNNEDNKQNSPELRQSSNRQFFSLPSSKDD